jgi:dTDP-glucose 4,6-dehydratase/UDP-glucose 4-epimerase
MKILIIGSKGFIGSNAVDYFTAKGHEVYGCGISGEPTDRYFVVNPLDPDYFGECFSKVAFDICINASGSPGVGFSLQNSDADFRMNVTNTERLLVAIAKSGATCKFICLSSAAVYGNPKYLPIDENHPVNPVSPYGFHKLQAELLVKEYHQFQGVQSVILRIFSAYGKHLKKQLFWDIYQKTLQGANIQLFGTGLETRDFISVQDILCILDLIIEQDNFKCDVYNVASGTETTIEKAANFFLNNICDDYCLTFIGQDKPGDPKNWVANIEKLRLLGFQSTVSFEQGLKKYAQWIKNSENS